MGEMPGCEEIDRRADDRRRERRYTFLDRRTGFDRRDCGRPGSRAGSLQYRLVCLREQPRRLLWLLVAANALNIADYGLTLNALANGFAEGNPVMGFLIEMSPVWAGVFKVFAVLLASLIVWQLRRYRKALIAALGMLVVFAAVFAWHLYGLLVML